MKLRMGMIGGGEGSMIGPVHRMAARLDGLSELVAAAFSSDPSITALTGDREGLDSSRLYASWQEMIINESRQPEGKRPHFISIVTPNHLHYGPAKMALEAGFHVICDKPLCMSVAEAIDLYETVERTGMLFCMTYNYSGYPMVKLAREMVLGGSLGAVRKIAVEYFQGWLASPVEKSGNRQASWRSDPARAGIAGALADIGTHAFNLAEYVSGLEVVALTAELRSVVPGRVLDDDGSVMLHFTNGSGGTLLASQIATGEENNLSIRIYGEKGGLSWRQMEPNTLTAMWPDRPPEVFRTGTTFADKGLAGKMYSRLPAGHPEGFIEAFANIYRNFALDIIAGQEGRNKDIKADYPGIYDGVRGMKFLEAVVASGLSNSARKTV
jgi:predicted dehydrogenase